MSPLRFPNEEGVDLFDPTDFATYPPEWRAALEQGIADADAGRLYRGRLGSDLPDPPRPSWKPDDPVQPEGWHHDGTRWRLNRDGGWAPDHSGFWRYTHPGDIGWREDPDHGRWRYFLADGTERTR